MRIFRVELDLKRAKDKGIRNIIQLVHTFICMIFPRGVTFMVRAVGVTFEFVLHMVSD